MMSSTYLLALAVACLCLSVHCEEDLTFDQPQTDHGPKYRVHIASDNGCGEDYCHIGDRCVPSGHKDKQNPCWSCDPTVSMVAWSYVKDGSCASEEFPLDTWHIILIVVGSVLLVTLLATIASYRIKQQLAKRQRVYPSHFVDVPYDKPLLKHMN